MRNGLTERQQVLRGLLHGRPMIAPALVLGLLGGDPNELTLEDQVAIGADLRALGYERRRIGTPRHAHLMALYVRDEAWPGETAETVRPYTGIKLRLDQDEEEFDRELQREAREREKAFYRRLDELYGRD